LKDQLSLYGTLNTSTIKELDILIFKIFFPFRVLESNMWSIYSCSWNSPTSSCSIQAE